jgi:hypothetical protein
VADPHSDDESKEGANAEAEAEAEEEEEEAEEEAEKEENDDESNAADIPSPRTTRARQQLAPDDSADSLSPPRSARREGLTNTTIAPSKRGTVRFPVSAPPVTSPSRKSSRNTPITTQSSRKRRKV